MWIRNAFQLQLQLQLYSFNLNLQFHDGFHPHIREPNRGGERDTQIKRKEREKKEVFYKQYQLSQSKKIIVCIKLIQLQYYLHREYKFSHVPELVKFKLMHDFSNFKIVIRFR